MNLATSLKVDTDGSLSHASSVRKITLTPDIPAVSLPPPANPPAAPVFSTCSEKWTVTLLVDTPAAEASFRCWRPVRTTEKAPAIAAG